MASRPLMLAPEMLSAKAWDIYRDVPLFHRVIQKYRPCICPFEALIPWMPQRGRVLDVGCGCGLLLLLLASFDYTIQGTGLDTSEAAIDVARRASTRLASNGSGATLQFLCVAPDAAWPDDEFDAVSVVDVLHHVPPRHQREFIHRAAERVRPGGTLIYKDMCRSPLWRAAANRMHDLCMAREWINYRNISDVEDWCAQLGFQLTHSEDITRLWYGHEMRIFVKK